MSALWIDKYRPRSLDELTFHPSTTLLLRELCARSDIPHLLLTGPSGGGKKTRIGAILNAVYGKGSRSVRAERKVLSDSSNPGSAEVEITVVSSNYHVEVCPSDAGLKDRLVVTELLKSIAQTRSFDASVPYKTVVIHDADRLSRGAQDALRRTMERYTRTCRVILVATAPCRVFPAIRSRCIIVRVPLPSQETVASFLATVAKEERIGTLPASVANRIAEMSGGNVRKALLMLESAKATADAQGKEIDETTEIQRADWEEYVGQIALDIVNDRTPNKLAEVRMKVYELLTHCIPPEMVLKQLAAELMNKVDTEVQMELISWATLYEHRIHLGSKPIYHIEAFIARFMSVYSHYLETSYMG